MIRARDPGAMSPTERLGEVAEILALGYRRRAARISTNQLDGRPEGEASCRSAVNARESRDAAAKESA